MLPCVVASPAFYGSRKELAGMILDHISNWRKNVAQEGFRKAFEYLEGLKGKLPADKRIEIDGSRVYALPMTSQGKGRTAARLETHRKYIDIQYIMSGTDTMGWKAAAGCKTIAEPYNEARDIEFFTDKPDTYFDVSPGVFVVFFPEDGHAPLAGNGEVVKVVVKIGV
ncbi:MAG: YhcH/YjgK/YiaL family protein [Verrucomicrobia bacterium]|nr:YhcH/YjgK/YiaL family protein [Verrucomicrobiota bacterium]